MSAWRSKDSIKERELAGERGSKSTEENFWQGFVIALRGLIMLDFSSKGTRGLGHNQEGYYQCQPSSSGVYVRLSRDSLRMT